MKKTYLILKYESVFIISILFRSRNNYFKLLAFNVINQFDIWLFF